MIAKAQLWDKFILTRAAFCLGHIYFPIPHWASPIAPHWCSSLGKWSDSSRTADFISQERTTSAECQDQRISKYFYFYQTLRNKLRLKG